MLLVSAQQVTISSRLSVCVCVWVCVCVCPRQSSRIRNFHQVETFYAGKFSHSKIREYFKNNNTKSILIRHLDFYKRI